RPVGFLAHGEFAAGGSAFEASIARLGHWKFSSVSGQCPKYRSGAPWKAMDGYGLETRYCNMLHQPGGSMWNVMERKFAMTRDARLSALHRGGFGPRGRASVSFGARRPTTAGICLLDPGSELLAARS